MLGFRAVATVTDETLGGLLIREATSRDAAFLWRMLWLAVAWNQLERITEDQLRADPMAAKYVDGWDEQRSFGLVLEDRGRLAGAAWCSFGGAADEIYGFVAPEVPVMAIALEAEYRDRRVGRALLKALIDQARRLGHKRMSLEVNSDNDRGRHLYESLGFREIRIQPDGASVMVAEL